MRLTSPVLHRTAPGRRSGDGDGNAQGDGDWRLVIRLERYSGRFSDEWVLGIKARLGNGYNHVLCAAGWYMGSIRLGLGRGGIRLCLDYSDRKEGT